jgi:hypothetical protein
VFVTASNLRLKRLYNIFHGMKAVCNCHCLRGTFPTSSGILLATISAHLLNLWMGRQPLGNTRSLAFGEQVDHLIRA